MLDAKPDVKAIFCEALEKGSSEELLACLAHACDGDKELRDRVEGLLRAEQAAGKFLGGPTPDQTATLDSAARSWERLFT